MNIDQKTKKVKTKESAYTLGFLWADGYLEKGKHTLRLLINISDADEIEDTIMDFEKFHKTKIKRLKNSWQDMVSFNKTRKKEYELLKEHGFYEKSFIRHKHILNLVPETLENYFWRGFFDGDGCIYIRKNGLAVINFTSSYDQDWTDLINRLKTIGLSPLVKKNINKNGNSSSYLTVLRKWDIVNFFKYIYPNKIYDFGLQRKFKKLNEFASHQEDKKEMANKKKEFVLQNAWNISKAKISKKTGLTPPLVKKILEESGMDLPPFGYWGKKENQLDTDKNSL